MSAIRVAQAAQIIGCSEERVRVLRRKGALSATRGSRNILLFDEAAIREFASTFRWLRSPVPDRLTRRLVKMPSGCIEWTGYRQHYGHGVMRVAGRLIHTHRVAWELTHGPVAPGLYVLHKCDNPPCCNVDHLYVGTHAQNVDDQHRRGRAPMPRKEIDIDVAVAMRRSGATFRQIGDRFGVSETSISTYFRVGRPSLGVGPLDERVNPEVTQ